MNGEGVVLCATLVERENGWGFTELNVTSIQILIVIEFLSIFVVPFVFLSLRESYYL